MLTSGSKIYRVDAGPALPSPVTQRGEAKLSIVIPVYRGEKTIERLVRTLLENLGSLYRAGNRAGQRRQPRRLGRGLPPVGRGAAGWSSS